MNSQIVKFIVLLAVARTAAGLTQVNPTVPASLLASAHASPVEFAMALANASVPAGLEIRESDDMLPDRWPVFNLDRTRRVSMADIVSAFNAERRDYHVARMHDVLVIRPVRATLPLLEAASAIDRPTRIVGAMAAARRVFAQLDPGLLGPILNSLGHPGDDLPIVLDGRGGRTVIDTLNQIVDQAPPRVWVVTTRLDGTDVRLVSFGLIGADGSRRVQGIVQPKAPRSRAPIGVVALGSKEVSGVSGSRSTAMCSRHQ